mgnify:CR=1 FL=1
MRETTAFLSDSRCLFLTEREARRRDFLDLIEAACGSLPRRDEKFNQVRNMRGWMLVIADDLASGIYAAALPKFRRAFNYLDEHHETITGRKPQ